MIIRGIEGSRNEVLSSLRDRSERYVVVAGLVAGADTIIIRLNTKQFIAISRAAKKFLQTANCN